MNLQEIHEHDEEYEWMMNWDRRRRSAAAQVLCYIAYVIKLSHLYYNTNQTIGPSTTPPNGKKRKKNPMNNNFCGNEFVGIKEAISSVVEAIREGNVIAKRGRARVYSEEEVFEGLVKLGVGVDDSKLRYRAYTFLTQSPSRARAFFGCPFEDRKDFLMQMMYSPCDL